MEEERVVVVDVTVEEEEAPVENVDETGKLEAPEMAALGTIVVTHQQRTVDTSQIFFTHRVTNWQTVT